MEIIHDSSCFAQLDPDAIAASHLEKRLQDQPPPNSHLSPSNVTVDSHSENTTDDVSCPTRMAHATAASPEKRLQVDSAHLSDQSPPTGSDIKDLSYLTPQLAPQATAASPEKRLQVDVQLISDPSRKKPRRGCRAGKKHRRNAIRKGYITAAQGSRGSQGRGWIPIMKTAAQGSRGPQRRGRISMAKAKTVASRSSNCRARVISKDSEDHDIGRRLDRGGRVHEFTTKRLDLGLDCSLVWKKVSPNGGEVISAS